MGKSSKSNFNRDASVWLFIAMLVGSMVAVLNFAPKDEHVHFSPSEKQKPLPYVPNVTWYEYPDGGWGTLSIDPTTGQKGKQIDSARIETLKNADSK